jgi:transposase
MMVTSANGAARSILIAVDTLGHLLALYITPANEQDRAQAEELAEQVQAATGQAVELAYVDQAYTGEQPAQDAQAPGLQPEVVKLPEARKGFVLLPRCWVVERSFAWVIFCEFITRSSARHVHQGNRAPPWWFRFTVSREIPPFTTGRMLRDLNKKTTTVQRFSATIRARTLSASCGDVRFVGQTDGTGPGGQPTRRAGLRGARPKLVSRGGRQWKFRTVQPRCCCSWWGL